MSWDISAPASGDHDTIYSWLQQFIEAIRERETILNGCNFNWPYGNRVYSTGRISAQTLSGGNITITCEILDSDGVTWVSASNDLAGIGWVDGSSVKRWTGFGGTYNSVALYDDVPADYKVAIYPATVAASGGSRPIPSDPKHGHTFAITDNADATLTVADDGCLTLNGKALSDYVGYHFDIIRRGASDSTRYGYSWLQRYPRFPNVTNDSGSGTSSTWEWGFVDRTKKLTASSSFTITVAGQPTTTLTNASTASDIQAALNALSTVDGCIVTGSGPFYITFPAANYTSTITSTATIIDALDRLGDISQTFTADDVGRDVIFKLAAGQWIRKAITAQDGHTLTFSAAASALSAGDYYAIVTSGAFWKPFDYAGIGGRTLRVELTERKYETDQRSRGTVNVWENNYYWVPFTWYSTLALTSAKSHDPITDEVGDYPYPADDYTTHECASFACDCNVDAPAGGRDHINPYDDDVLTLPENYCVGEGDKLLSPYLYWSIRGWQLAIERLVPSFIEDKDYTSAKAIPNFVNATWIKAANSGNSHTVTISSISGSDAVFSSISLPNATTQQGAYTSLSCDWALLENDDVIGSGTGTVTTTHLTPDDFTFISPDHVGLHLIISLGWTGKYERRVKALWPSTVFAPDVDPDSGLPVFPPSDDFPGSYDTEAVSTNYSEYSKYGVASDSGHAFINDEAARYDPLCWSSPTQWDDYYDLHFAGKAYPDTDFPSFEYSGSATAGGNYFLEDAGQDWWVSTSLIKTNSGTATGGSSSTLSDTTKSADPFWLSMGGQRFVGMILEVQFTSGVWDRRPITAMSGTTLTVAPSFPSTTSGKQYRIREPGGKSSAPGKGAILNTMKGRKMTITHIADSSTDEVTITNSDDNRLYWSTSESVTAAVGDTYSIENLQAGKVIHRKSGAWKLDPADATADSRGHDWFGIQEGIMNYGVDGRLLNCPTIVSRYGSTIDSRLRKGDIITFNLYSEMYKGLNALRWTKEDVVWTNVNADGDPEDNEHDGDGFNTGNPRDTNACSDAQDLGLNGFEGWNNTTDIGVDNQPPIFGSVVTLSDEEFQLSASLISRYAFASTTPPDCYYRAIDVYSRCEIYGAPADEFCDGSSMVYPDSGVTISCNFIDPVDGVTTVCITKKYTFDGDGMTLANHAFGIVGSISATLLADPRVRCGPASVDTAPGYGSCPTVPADDGSPCDDVRAAASYKGFQVLNSVAVVKWDVTGGFKYVD